MKRRIAMFAERDRVQLHVLTDGSEFVWRGARWVLQDGVVYQRATVAKQSVVPKAKTRVIVTRKSGFASMEQSVDERRRIEKENAYWQTRDERALIKAKLAREREATSEVT